VGCITGSGYEQHHVSEVEPFEVAAVEGREHVGAGLLRTRGDVLATVPVALLFSFVQGVFVRGITAGAVKG
jgi:ABC-type glycerol-3-phosphate transport system permease component